MSMPEQKPGRSRQDYGTPPDLLKAIRNRLKIPKFTWDLAADANNTVTLDYYDEAANSLKQDWSKHCGWLWLNPPFADIEPWVKKATLESHSGAQIAMLIPASVGANWWRDWVDKHCYQVFLNGRLTFVGETTPYPKDCALLMYTPWGFKGSEVWDWRTRINA